MSDESKVISSVTIRENEEKEHPTSLGLYVEVRGEMSLDEAYEIAFDKLQTATGRSFTVDTPAEDDEDLEESDDEEQADDQDEEESEDEPEEEIEEEGDEADLKATAQSTSHLWDIESLCKETGYSQAYIYAQKALDNFPEPVTKLGKKNLYDPIAIKEWALERKQAKISKDIAEQKVPKPMVQVNSLEDALPEKKGRSYLDMEDVVTATGFDEDTIDYFVQKKKFPAPNAEGLWVKTEVDEYLDTRNSKLK